MKELIIHCNRMLELIDQDYGNQKSFPGIIKKINQLVQEILIASMKGTVYQEKINFIGLARQFVDETTHYSSPILIEFEAIRNILEELQEKN